MVRLPVPPSVNNLFSNKRGGGGRFITPKYRAWRNEAGTLLNIARPIKFGGIPVELAIYIPEKTRGDLSNRIKALEDLIVAHGLINDDRQVKRILVEYHESAEAVLSIQPFGSPSLESRMEAARRTC
jgi:Holliday junction resolvase RusA-like endonuclease